MPEVLRSAPTHAIVALALAAVVAVAALAITTRASRKAEVDEDDGKQVLLPAWVAILALLSLLLTWWLSGR
jgi:hypothetical protein